MYNGDVYNVISNTWTNQQITIRSPHRDLSTHLFSTKTGTDYDTDRYKMAQSKIYMGTALHKQLGHNQHLKIYPKGVDPKNNGPTTMTTVQ